jgi:hypothetical protein
MGLESPTHRFSSPLQSVCCRLKAIFGRGEEFRLASFVSSYKLTPLSLIVLSRLGVEGLGVVLG